MNTRTKIVTRFAPSPTGFLHVGGLRTALYNYLFAKKHQGSFILRIEDTDQNRMVAGAADHLEVMLKYFNLHWDNEIIIFQSKQLAVYQRYSEQLIKDKKAYRCFCNKERLQELRKEQQAKKLPPRYDGACRQLSEQEISSNLKAGKNFVIRLMMPQTGSTSFVDAIRGAVSFDNKNLDDQIIIKSDGFPTYHLASVIDDHQAKVTHVVRGEEWLPSTPKHITLYQALNWQAPVFTHLPLLVNHDRSKLSKRQGDVAVEYYLKKGYLPEALLNFILLLGWNPGTDQEIFSLDEMIKQFSLEKVHKSAAVFNTQKLDWLNSHYIKQKNITELAHLAKPFFDRAQVNTDLAFLAKVVSNEQERIKRLDELVEKTSYFFKRPRYDACDLIWKTSDAGSTAVYLAALIELLATIPEKNWTTADLEEHTKALIVKRGWGNGDVLWPMRFALSGRKASPGPFEIAYALGKQETVFRLKKALQKLEK